LQLTQLALFGGLWVIYW